MTRSLRGISRAFQDIPEKAFAYFRDHTPKRSGNARRNTKLQKGVIVANYPYAERLDQGLSKQAPLGMTEPTLAYVKQLGDQAIRK